MRQSGVDRVQAVEEDGDCARVRDDPYLRLIDTEQEGATKDGLLYIDATKQPSILYEVTNKLGWPGLRGFA